MARRAIWLGVGLLVVAVGLFAFVMPEVRLAWVVLGLAIAAAGSWLSMRLPASPVSIRELRGAAVTLLVVGVATAVLIPSTRVKCVCPAPLGTRGGYMCNCPIDHHVVLRLGIALACMALSLILASATRRRAEVLG
jgi:hypothetical protein